MKLSDLMKKYKGFSRSSATIKINGNLVYPDNAYLLDSLEINLTITNEINHVFIKLSDIKDETAIYNTFLCGSKAIVEIGYSENEVKVFTGYIHLMKSICKDGHLTEAEIYLQDVRGLMKLSSHYKYANKNVSLLLSDVLKQSLYTSYIDGVIIGNIPRSFKNMHVVQKDNDYDFVCYLSQLFHFDFYCDCENLYFQKAYKNKQLTLEFDEHTHILYTEVISDVQNQMGSYHIVGYGKDYVNVSHQGKHDISTLPLSSKMTKITNSKQYIVVDELNDTASLQEYGTAESEKRKHQFLKVNIMICLLPDVVCGDIIKISISKKLENKKVYVEKIKHEITKYSSYTYIEGSMIE